MVDVFVHIGLAKTGTTTIQAALEAQSGQLAEAGVLFPGGTHRAQRLAIYDLLGQRVHGEDKQVVAGAFRRLIEEATRYEGGSVVISEEELSLARPRHVRRLVRALGDRRVVVVIGVRDLARTLVSAWQQSIVQGSVTTWQDYAASVRDDHGFPSPSHGVAFWLRHDLLRVIDVWSQAVPPERIRVVTVPRKGADSRVLLDRFARAAELPADAWRPDAIPPRNVSLGCAELEVVRRLNLVLNDRLNLAQYRFVIESGIRARLEQPAPPQPPTLPAEFRPWAHEHGVRLVAELHRLGVPLIGDEQELVPDLDPPTDSQGRSALVDERELLAATEASLISLALAHGALYKRYRKAFASQEGRWPGLAEVAGSGVRAAWFGTKKRALRRSDSNRMFAWAARSYLSRTAPPHDSVHRSRR
jgi:hypothetical protein